MVSSWGRIAALAVTVLVMASGAAGAVSLQTTVFFAPVLYGADSFPTAIAIGDLSGDGKPDLAVVNKNWKPPGSGVSLLRGVGSGRFEAWLTPAVGTKPDAIVLHDLDGDGALDAAVTSRSSAFVSVLYGPGFDRLDVPVAKGVSAVGAGDFDGDAVQDLAVANANQGTVSLLLGQGGREFSGPTATTPVGSDPESLVVRDLDRDGKLDVAVANYGSTSLSVLYGNGNGGFGSVQTLAIGTKPTAVAVGDLNKDGKLDLAATLRGALSTKDANMLSVVLGTGGRGFGPKQLYGKTSAHPSALTVGDVDGDSNPDVITGSGDSAQATLFYGDGSWGPTLPRKLELFAAGRAPRAVAAGYLNGDSQLDLAFAASYLDGVAVVLGDGAGGLREMPNVAVGSLPVAAAVGDLDGDGILDAAVANSNSATVSLLHGTGDPRKPFETARADLQVGAGPNDVAIDDLDGDGKLDVVVASISSNSVTIWTHNTTVETAIWSHGLTVKTTIAIGAGTAPHAVAVGDLNGDSRLDLVTANLGSGPDKRPGVTVLINQGNVQFAASALPAGSQPVSVTIADVTNDGLPDVAVADFASAQVALLRGLGGGTFAPASFVAAGGSFPTAITSGDLNGDGVDDLVVTNRHASTVSVLLATGGGGLEPAQPFDVGVGYKPVAVAIGYLNGDAYPDLAVANSGGRTDTDYCHVRGFDSGGISILAGDGSGAFQAAGSYASLNDACDVAIGDLDKDGRLDLTVPASRTRVFESYLNETP